jgi:hypothetical protein
MSFRSEVFARVGPFSPEVGCVAGKPVAGDETEFCLRAAALMPGAKIFYEPGAIIYHKIPKPRQTLNHLLRRSYGEGVGKAIIGTMANSNGQALGSETAYLRHLATQFLPSRVRGVLAARDVKQNLGQVAAVASTVAATGLGYALTRLQIATRRIDGPDLEDHDDRLG